MVHWDVCMGIIHIFIDTIIDILYTRYYWIKLELKLTLNYDWWIITIWNYETTRVLPSLFGTALMPQALLDPQERSMGVYLGIWKMILWFWWMYINICKYMFNIHIYTCRYILYIELDSSYLNPFDNSVASESLWFCYLNLERFFLLKQFFGVCTCNYRELEGFAARKLHSLQQNPGSNCRSFGLCDCSWLWIFAHFLLDQSKNPQLQGFCADGRG